MLAAKNVEMGTTAEETTVTMNPMVNEATQGATRAAVPTPSRPMSKLKLVIAVLAVTNIVAIAVAVTFVVKDQNSSTHVRDSTSAVFSANHPQVEPSSRTPVQSASRLLSEAPATHFRRSHTSWVGTSRENLTIASGVNRIIHPDSGEAEFDVHTEIYVDGLSGEYAGVNGAIGNRALRLRIVDLKSGAEVILIPHSLSFATNFTLIPNHYQFSYLAAPGATPVNTYISTAIPGRVVHFNEVGSDEWQSFMPRFFDVYEKAWLADHPSASRRLGFGSWAAGKIGGWIGGHFGSAGRGIGASAATNLYNGEDVGQSVGGAVGGYVGSDVGSAVGGDVGAAGACPTGCWWAVCSYELFC